MVRCALTDPTRWRERPELSGVGQAVETDGNRMTATFDSENLAYFSQPNPGYVVTILEDRPLPQERSVR